MGLHLKPLTEAEFTRQVIAFARLHGWRVAHFRSARTARGWRTPVQGDGKGFPDLILVGHSRIIVAELKVGRKTLTADQTEWIAAFVLAGAGAYVWYPSDWPEIESVLQ